MNLTLGVGGFRTEFLSELEIAERQLLAMAEAIPTERYAWRADIDVRSVSEIFVHIAGGNFLLLDSSNGPERLRR